MWQLLQLQSLTTSKEMLIISSIMIVWYTLMTVIGIWKLCIEKSQPSLPSFQLLRNLVIVTNVFFALSFLSIDVNGFIAMGGLRTSLLYLSFIHVLKVSFVDSAFEIPSTMWYSYLVILVIIVLLFALSFILLAIAETTAFIYSLSAAALLVALVAVHVAYSFISRLFLLVLQQRQSVYLCESQNAGVSNSELNDKQLKLVQLITKHTILWMQGIATFLIAMIVSAIGTAVIQQSHPTVAFFMFVICICLSLVVISKLCLLVFRSTESWYASLCAPCDKWTTRCCVKLAEKQLLKTDAGRDLESYVKFDD